MSEQEVLDFILSELKRLNEEKHVMDLCKAGQYEELSQIECNYPEEVVDWFKAENILDLKAEEIPKEEGMFLAFAIWLHNAKDFCECEIFEDWEKFADILADEAGELGKSIAYQMDNACLNHIDHFFTDEYAGKYAKYCIDDDDEDSKEE